jgi:hypothetical protein
MHCTTDGTGKCSVIYRDIRQVMGASPLTAGTQDLTVSIPAAAAYSITSYTSAWPGHPITVGWTTATRPVKGLVYCAPATGSTNVTVLPTPSVQLGPRPADFWVPDLLVTGSSGKITCIPTAVDASASTALNCVATPSPHCVDGSNPDAHDANAPVGTMTLFVDGLAYPPCTLQRRDGPLPGTAQANNQTPFVSECPPVTFTLAGLPGETHNVVASLDGGGLHPTHYNWLDHTNVVRFS